MTTAVDETARGTQVAFQQGRLDRHLLFLEKGGEQGRRDVGLVRSVGIIDQFLAKPELEIYADDVVCSHGSTSGAIDDEALFYLRSRGVPHGIATDLLTLAFLAEAVEEIEDEALRDVVVERLEGWLERHRS